MEYYIMLILGWTFYFFMHSLLATNRVKSFFHAHNSKVYRLVYSTISIIGLLFLLYINASHYNNKLFNNEGLVRYFSMMLATFGVIIIQQAFKQYSLKKFVGLAKDEEEFRMEGILSHIRHPLYAGTILIILGFFLFTPTISTLLSMVCIFTYLPIGIYLEEKKLISLYGEQYLNYKKKVPMLFPRFYSND